MIDFYRLVTSCSKTPTPGPGILQSLPSLKQRPLCLLYSLNWTDSRKRDLCPGSRWTILSIHHGYLVTKLSCGAFSYVGSLNDSRVTVNECVGDNGLKSQSANNTGSMHFVSVVHDYGQQLNQSLFSPRAVVSFPCAHQFSKFNRKEASASRE